MNDLISRKAAVNALLTLGFVWDDSLSDVEKEELNYAIHGIIMAYKERIEQLPSAQPEIIRCRECKFYTPMNRETKTGICNLTLHQNFGDDWYCAGAERRTDD